MKVKSMMVRASPLSLHVRTSVMLVFHSISRPIRDYMLKSHPCYKCMVGPLAVVNLNVELCYLSHESFKDVYLNYKTDTDSFVFLYFAGMYDVSGPYSSYLFPTFIDAWCPGVSNTLQSMQCFRI